ncbi:MAG: MerR family transcriptional regulator [Planctomycetota bacterium]|jgi:DNA-binding transcriptional MerR regulator/methylmalonyl-CoA mutase cobalamin-binding subunit
MGDDGSGELVSIGGLAAATGISPDAIRVWERRYGRPRPIRLPSGHRRYTPEQIRWLRRVAEALAGGHRPAQAVRASDEELDRLLGRRDERRETEDLTSYLASLHGYREGRLLDRLWQDWRRLGPEEFLNRVLSPLVRQVGQAWADGELDIRHEHFLTRVLEHFLSSARLSVAERGEGLVVLLTTLPGESHGLGLQMAALVCVRAGARPRILGVETPHEEIARAAAEVPADVVGVSVSLSSGGVETDRALARLRERLPADVRLVVGGRGARGARRGPRGVDYVGDLDEFGAWLTKRDRKV